MKGAPNETASPAVSCMSGSSNLDGFRDGRQVVVLASLLHYD